MTTAITRLPNSAFELTITLPWDKVKEVYDRVFEELASEIEIEGFRKGKAPRELAEKHLDKDKIYGETINRLVPEAYRLALQEHNLKPIVSPQIKITQAEEGRDWQMIIQSAEKPEVRLGNYRQVVSEINAKNKIWVPGKDDINQNTENKAKDKREEEEKRISEIVNKLLETCQVDLPEILLNAETNRLLTALLEDIRAAGLTYEQYLQSSGQTAEEVRAKYAQQARQALKLEFILEAVADDLKIEVSPEEIRELIAKETDEKRKAALEQQTYLLATILRRDKTIARLLVL